MTGSSIARNNRRLEPIGCSSERQGGTLEDRINGLLRDLGNALVGAIVDSEEISERLREIQREGYTLFLRVDCRQDESEDEEVTSARPRADARPDPVFRINTQDLSFLRSIGIDPTRKSRGRRP